MAARRTVSRGSFESAISAGALSGSRTRPSVSAARTRTCGSGLPRAWRSRGTTRAGDMRASAPIALSWMSSLSSPSSSNSSMAASSWPSRPMAAAASARTSWAGSWMSGATSSIPPAGAIHDRQRTVPCRTASLGCSSPRA